MATDSQPPDVFVREVPPADERREREHESDGAMRRGKLAAAWRASVRAWRVGRMVVRPLLPKKWTPQKVAIAAVVVVVIALGIYYLLQTLFGMARILVAIGLAAAGLYLLFLAPRKMR